MQPPFHTKSHNRDGIAGRGSYDHRNDAYDQARGVPYKPLNR